MSTHQIYLISGGDGAPLYVGMTKGCIWDRLGAHIDAARAGRGADLHSWMAPRLDSERFTIGCIDVADGAREARAFEAWWIAYYRTKNPGTLNINDHMRPSKARYRAISDSEPIDTVSISQFLSSFGRKGGAAKSEAKRKAGANNLAKAREALRKAREKGE